MPKYGNNLLIRQKRQGRVAPRQGGGQEKEARQEEKEIMAQAPPMRFLKPDNPYNPVGLPDFGPHMLPWAPWSDNPHSPVWQWIDPTGPTTQKIQNPRQLRDQGAAFLGLIQT